jgi:predicted nucleotidyltransferase
MDAGQRIREHRDEILRVAGLHGAGNVLIFGSVARGEDTPESDVALLVDITGLRPLGFREVWSPTSSNSWVSVYK